MRSNKVIVVLVIVAMAATALISNGMADWKAQQEKTRVESILAPVITAAGEGSVGSKPTLSFANVSDKSVTVVLSWDQKPEAAPKNEMREKMITSIRRELSLDPKSWGRHVSVIFDDEVVTQGVK